MSTRVVIADDHTIVREGLRRILEGQEGIEVTGEAVNGHEVMERVRAGNFELLLLDLSMPGKSGIELIKQVRDEAPRLRILVLTMHEEDQPCHLVVTQPDLCSTRCVEEFGNPCQHFCPAAVYEMEEKAGTKHGVDLKINASNCVHCKTCDIMDPYQVINWVTPEGGGGPNYTNL